MSTESSSLSFADSECSFRLPELRSALAEKVAQGFYINVDVNREQAARYGLTIADVQTAVASSASEDRMLRRILKAGTVSHQRPLPKGLSR